jgi:hypothetical protein
VSGSDYALPRAEDCSPADVTLADRPTTVNPSASRARGQAGSPQTIVKAILGFVTVTGLREKGREG